MRDMFHGVAVTHISAIINNEYTQIINLKTILKGSLAMYTLLYTLHVKLISSLGASKTCHHSDDEGNDICLACAREVCVCSNFNQESYFNL